MACVDLAWRPEPASTHLRRQLAIPRVKPPFQASKLALLFISDSNFSPLKADKSLPINNLLAFAR
jgi:hypothetical protein